MYRPLDVASSFAATLVRALSGIQVQSGSLGARPEQPLELYEFEGCPFCRKVREALTNLDLDAVIYPCPKNGPRYREELIRRGGKPQFPYLVDPNTDTEMYESDDIVQYLYDSYGDGQVPLALRAGPLTMLTVALPGVLRPGLGTHYRAARAPEQPLELWSFEGSPFCRIVRETLCSLELPYRLHNVGKASPGRDAFVKRSGKMMVPFLSDPNTGTELFESADIKAYLEQTYALPE
jgi:glutathione S-transferase